MMKAIVDKKTCTGCELCVKTCPEVFWMEADKSVSYVDAVHPEIEDICRQAANECPVEAITIQEVSSEFSAGEFKGSMAPEALIQAIKTGSKIDVPRANTSIESLNNLLQRKDLYEYMTKQPNEVTHLINRLKQGQELNPFEIVRLNRLTIEANYPRETPKSLQE